jgi:hypothetical protein
VGGYITLSRHWPDERRPRRKFRLSCGPVKPPARWRGHPRQTLSEAPACQRDRSWLPFGLSRLGGNETHFPREVAEAALAHVVGDAAERAYRSGDALEKRRALMRAWADFLAPSTRGNVVNLPARG